MSETSTQLLLAFSSLPADEQHEVMLALLRCSGELAINDDQLVWLAEEAFLSLVAEETNDTGGSKG